MSGLVARVIPIDIGVTQGVTKATLVFPFKSPRVGPCNPCFSLEHEEIKFIYLWPLGPTRPSCLSPKNCLTFNSAYADNQPNNPATFS